MLVISVKSNVLGRLFTETSERTRFQLAISAMTVETTKLERLMDSDADAPTESRRS